MRFVSGLPETVCGHSSTLKETEAVREWLPRLIKQLGVKTFLDAPCGDCNWISKVPLGAHYIGVDNDADNLLRAGRRGINVKNIDITSDLLPHADMVMCRDCLQHLPNRMVLDFLENFVFSGAEWLLATSHRSHENHDTKLGGFRALNLTLAPIGLPEPRQAIDDGGRLLALWHSYDVESCLRSAQVEGVRR